MRAVLEGDSTAREEFAERMRITSRILAARNARRGRPLSDAELEDLSQDTLVSVWRRLPGYEGRAALETWVYRFCTLEWMNALRRKRKDPERLAEDAAANVPERDPGAPESERAGAGIARFLRHLSEREAAVVRLRHVDQLSFREIGEALDISASSAKTHYYRGIEKLRDVAQEARP